MHATLTRRGFGGAAILSGGSPPVLPPAGPGCRPFARRRRARGAVLRDLDGVTLPEMASTPAPEPAP